MPNPIKYSTGSESDALKKGNLYIGTGAVGKGPSETTGYYQGPSVPTNGYVIYMNKVGAPGGLSYHSAANDSELISFTNSLAGESFTTVTQCFNYYYGQTDKVLVTQDYPADFPYIVLDGLVLYLDAGISQSYPGSGTVWTDVNGLGPKNNGTLINGPTFNSANGGSIVFDGVNDYISISHSDSTNIRGSITVGMFCKSDHNLSTGWNMYWAGVSKYSQFILGPNGIGGKMAFLVHSGTWYPLGYGGSIWGQTNIDVRDYHYYVGVYNQSTGFLSLYVDGSLEVTFNIGVRTLSDDPNDFVINKRDVSNNYLKSTNSIVQIYNRALTDAEILQNYNATKGRFGL